MTAAAGGAGAGTGSSGIARHRFAGQLAEPISHYTDAVVAGGFLFVSGMLPTDAGGAIVGVGDVVAQAEQVFENIEIVLGGLGCSLAEVVKVVVYLTDVADRETVNSVRRRRFGEARPTSTLVQVGALAHPDARIEIEAVAFLGDRAGAGDAS